MLRLRPYLVVVFFAVLSFGLTLRIGFIWDDHEMIENNPVITRIDSANLAHAFSHDVFEGKGDPYYRPLQTVANMVDYSIWGLSPRGYHFTNLFFHLIAVVLLLLLFRSLFDDRLAFISTAFFAVNPIVVEQLIIIAGRAELMAMAFMLASLICCLRRTNWSYALGLLFYALACLSKESGVIAPLLLALIAWMRPDRKPSRWVYGAYASVFVVYWWLRGHAVAAPPMPAIGELAKLSVREMPTIFLEYIRIILFPIDLHSHRKMVFARPFIVLSPIAFVLFAILAYQKKSRLALFAAGWFFIGMLPKVPNFAVSSLMLDHWGYVSAIGIFLLIARGLVILSEKTTVSRAMAGGLFSIILTGWIFCSWASIYARKTDYELLRHALRYPTSSVVRGNLALLYLDNGLLDPAEKLADEAIAMNPLNNQVRMIKERITFLRQQNSRPNH